MRLRRLSATTIAAACILPTGLGLKLPVCGADKCLPHGTFNDCSPSDFICLCVQPQKQIDEYLDRVKPCLYTRDRGVNSCSRSGLWQYMDNLYLCCTELGKTVDFWYRRKGAV
ncbi:hypothetical protein K458DRAFT_178654 [Lentithecium fluviatile CBS 122367]|uniref:Extracellular membrane protein CFEM domain-containing protein n=1 Tax=Lentithecium fluviatile CBS 122367 TaxID=1168545 RepID=A0A6G1IFW3_9PLEO|nr:hypothetical protein K458DRAFT_178654 [Lentithecium fluviatile CBS 122367]